MSKKEVIILKDTSSGSLADRIANFLDGGFTRVGDLIVVPSQKRIIKSTGQTLFEYTYIQQMERDVEDV